MSETKLQRKSFLVSMVFFALCSLFLSSCDGKAGKSKGVEGLSKSKTESVAGSQGIKTENENLLDSSFTKLMSNGIHLIQDFNPDITDGYVLTIQVGAGANEDPVSRSGLAHLVEHLILASAYQKLNSQNKFIKQNHLIFGRNFNGLTEPTRTTFGYKINGNDFQSLVPAILSIVETIQNFETSKLYLEREKSILLSEVYNRRSGQKMEDATAFGKFLLPTRNIRSYQMEVLNETIPKITLQDVRDFHVAYYVPGNITIVVRGNFHQQEFAERIESKLDLWKTSRKDVESSKKYTAAIEPHPKFKFEKSNNGTSQLRIVNNFTFSENERDDLTWDKQIKKMIISELVSSRIKSVFLNGDWPGHINFEHLENENGYASVVSISSNADEQLLNAVSSINYEFRRIREFGFKKFEIKDARLMAQKKFEQSLIRGVQSVDYFSSDLLSATNLGLVPLSVKRQLELFESVEVDLSLAEEVALTTKLTSMNASRYWLKTKVGSKLNYDTIVSATGRLNTKPLTLLPTVQSIPMEVAERGDGFEFSSVYAPQIGVTKTNYKNGVRLNFKQIKSSTKKVDIRVNLDGGWLNYENKYPKIRSNIGSLSAAGINSLSLKEFEQYKLQNDININFLVASDRLGLVSSVHSRNLEATLSLLQKYITDLNWESESSKSDLQRKIRSRARRASKTPLEYGKSLIPYYFGGRNKTFEYPRYSEVSKYSSKMVREVAKSAFSSGAIEIGIAGDVENSEVVKLVGEIFGTIPERSQVFSEPTFNGYDRIVSDGRYFKILDKSRTKSNRDAVFCGWPIESDLSSLDLWGMSMIQIIWEQRLHRQGRNTHGDFYSPYVKFVYDQNLKTRRYFVVGVELSPSSKEDFYRLVENIRLSLVQKKITIEEFESAKKIILGSANKLNKSNKGWVNELSVLQSKPETEKKLHSRLSLVNDINFVDLQTLAESQFSKDREIFLTVGH